MKTARAVTFAAALPLLGLALSSSAQMPTDNDTWKKRCEVLRDADPTARGVVPAWLQTAPQAVPGPRWTTFGFDRAHARQSYVACTFFYLGAIADHNHGNAHADRVHAHESAVMGKIMDKAARHEKITPREKLTKGHAEAAEIPKPALTIPEEEAMLAAATTMPLESPADNPPPPQPAKPRPDVPKTKRR